MLEDTRAKIQNEENEKITSMKTIVEHTLECAKEKAKPKEITSKINHVRLWKISMLPCEVVGMNRNNTSTCGEKDDEHSLSQCKFKMPKV